MTRWRAFLALCQHLRKGLLDGNQPTVMCDQAWELVIEASSYHFVTPALAWCLRGAPLPIEISDFLDKILSLNEKRNNNLLAGLARVVTTLNSIDIEPVLLKGCARLVDCTYPSNKLRFLGDLDVLIPEPRTAAAVAALNAMGFRTHPTDEDLPASHHHLRMLHDLETGAGVELHTALLPHDGASLLSVDWFYRGTRPFRFNHLAVRLPDPTRSVGHIVAHDQILDNDYCYRRLELRQLVDLAMIRKRSEAAVDWAELDERFCSVGLGRVLPTYMKFGQTLLGQSLPPLRHSALPTATIEFRWTMDPNLLGTWGRFGLTGIRYLGRSLNHRDVRSLLHVGKWRERIREEFKPKPPSW